MIDEDLLDQEADETEELDKSPEESAAEPSLQDQLKEVVEIGVEEIGPLRKKLTVTVPHEFIDKRLEEQYGELRRDAAVPGFRKGRAPRRLLEKRFGHEVGETMVQQLLSSGYLAAIEKSDLKVIGDPLVWVREKGSDTDSLMDVQKAIDNIELPEEGAFTFSCEIEVQPEFELPETEGIALRKPILSISEEEVDNSLDRVRRLRGNHEPVPDGLVELDDVLLADVKLTSEGTVLKEEEGVRMAARPQPVDGIPFNDLGQVLTGARPGDVRTATSSIPDDYPKQQYRGKPVEVEVRVRDIQRLQVPELDQEFISRLGFDNLDELRTWIRADLESRLDEAVRRGLAGQVYQYLLDKTQFELPGRLSERQTQRVMLRRMLELYRQGVPPAEVDKNLDELRTGAQEATARELKVFFIMNKLAEQIEVEVSESEMNAQIAGIAQRQNRRFDRVRDQLAKEGSLADLYLQLRDEKIVDQLIAKAQITEATPEEIEAEQKAKAEPAAAKAAGEAPASEAGPEEPVPAAEQAKPKRPRRKPPPKQEKDLQDET